LFTKVKTDWGFTVLKGGHRSCIDVQVWIDLDHIDLQQQSAPAATYKAEFLILNSTERDREISKGYQTGSPSSHSP
jgi:hypothetical protein